MMFWQEQDDQMLACAGACVSSVAVQCTLVVARWFVAVFSLKVVNLLVVQELSELLLSGLYMG